MITTEEWAGEFGDSYTDRNMKDWMDDRTSFWNALVKWHKIETVLEVGCGIGVNLQGMEAQATGVDVNQTALALVPEDIPTVEAEATDLPFDANTFDLAFTFGVLIHIPPKDIETAMREIVRVSKRFVLAAEYLGDDEVPYRDGVLWRRDYGALYEQIGLTTVKHGVLEGEPWDRGRVDYWLMKEQPRKEGQ